MWADTIVARATPSGKGGVCIVRLSGSKAQEIAERLTKKNSNPRIASYAQFYDSNKELIDEGLLIFFQAPHSFTGENVIEFQIHGNPLIEERLIRAAVSQGARLAEPGEFSKRAFLNGKMDLTQAEGLCDLINASTQTAVKAAQRSLQGTFSSHINNLAKDLRLTRVELEAWLDFPEEVSEAREKLTYDLAQLKEKFSILLAQTKNNARLLEGLKVALVGEPNVGKSSLLNLLAQEEVAIVSHIPGTTRDVLERTIEINGVNVLLFDTAGLRESEDPIEQEGIRRAKLRITQADMVWWLQTGFESKNKQPPFDVENINWVRLINKIDLLSMEERKNLPKDVIAISARTGEGIDSLKATLFNKNNPIDENAFLARTRHVLALERAFMHMSDALKAFESGNYLELVAEACRQAHEALFEIIGKVTSDELLGDIFSAFCIGK